MQALWRRCRPVLLVALLVASLVVSTPGAAALSVAPDATASTVAAESSASPASAPVFAQVNNSSTQNNSSVRHLNPDEVDAESTLDRLQGVLGSRLATRLSDSTVELSQAEYDQARSLLGEEYLEQFDKYADVADERNDDTATETSETFEEVGSTQRDYVRTVEEFRETHDAYEAAREAGNQARARELARRLDRLGAQAERNATRLQTGYGRLGNLTGTDLSESSARIQAVQTNVSDVRAQVRETEFVETTLEIRDADRSGSFTDPLRIEATLDSEAGPVANRTVTIAVGRQTMEARTDESGEFVLDYRPTLIASDVSSVNLSYVPDAEGRYLDSQTSIPVSLTQTTGQISISGSTATAGFGDTVTVRGRVAVDATAVPNAPVVVVVDGTRLGQVRTDEFGSFVFEGSLPASPASGERDLSVRFGVGDRAVRADSVSTSIDVESTEPTLTASSSRQGTVTEVSGRLTANERPVGNQTIAVRVDGEPAGSTETSADGTYTLDVSDAVPPGENVTAVVRFDGGGTNLESVEMTVEMLSSSAAASASSAGSTATDAASGGAEGGGEILATLDALFSSPLALVGGGIVLGAVGLAVVALRRREGEDATGEPASTTATDSDGAVDASEESTPETTTHPLAVAEDDLGAGASTDTVLETYAAVRRDLSESVSTGRALTHWQFFDACVASGVDAEALRTVTETYERAQYGGVELSAAEAEAAVDAARRLL